MWILLWSYFQSISPVFPPRSFSAPTLCPISYPLPQTPADNSSILKYAQQSHSTQLLSHHERNSKLGKVTWNLFVRSKFCESFEESKERSKQKTTSFCTPSLRIHTGTVVPSATLPLPRRGCWRNNKLNCQKSY